MNSEPLTPRTRLLLALICVATILSHFAFSLHFYTAGSNNAPKSDLRLSGEAYLAEVPSWGTENESDAAAYNRAAVEAMKTGVPRSHTGVIFDHAPVYAWFLAGVYSVGGVRYMAVLVSSALLAGGICLMLALTAKSLSRHHSGAAAVFAALLYLVNVKLAQYVGYVNPTLLLLLFVSTAFHAVVCRYRHWRVVFIAAIVLGIWTQASFFLVGLAAGGWLFLLFLKTRHRADILACLALFTLAGSKLGVSLLEGKSPAHDSMRRATRGIIWEANNPYYERMTVFSLWERRPGNRWSDWKATPDEEARYAGHLAKADDDPVKAARAWIAENPAQYATVCVVRLRAFLGPITGQMSPANKVISTVLWLAVFPAGFFVFWKVRRDPLSWLAWAIAITLGLFETLVIAGWQPRYRLPMDMALTVAAAVFYAYVLGRFREKMRT